MMLRPYLRKEVKDVYLSKYINLFSIHAWNWSLKSAYQKCFHIGIRIPILTNVSRWSFEGQLLNRNIMSLFKECLRLDCQKISVAARFIIPDIVCAHSRLSFMARPKDIPFFFKSFLARPVRSYKVSDQPSAFLLSGDLISF